MNSMYLYVFQVKFNSNFLLYLHSRYIFRLNDVFRYHNKRLYSAFVITVNKEALYMVCSLFLSTKQYWPVKCEKFSIGLAENQNDRGGR